MNIFRPWITVALLLLMSFATVGAASAYGLQSDASQPAASADAGMLHYTLPPDKLAKAHALYNLHWWMYLITTVWGFIVLWIMLRGRFGPWLRNLADRTSRFRFLQAVIVMSLFVLVTQLTSLPFDMYDHHISLSYGLSVQGWPSWFGDWGKGLVLGFIFASLVGWILYGVLRRSPRRWWFYFWLALIPILVLVMFIAPIWIEPLFNKFQPLEQGHADLVAQIERVVQRAGMSIPPDRMFEMKASEKTNELNAYVSGFGSSKRVVVWDTTMAHMSIPQTLFVFGHEMGHYVLYHIPKEMTLILLQLLLIFYISYRVVNWALAKYGEAWGIQGLSDWASLPLLMLIMSVFLFLDTPGMNVVSRHYEHQADQYGLEVIHGLVPDEGLAAAQAFQILGERSLDYPYVGKFAEWWSWSHPTIADRMVFVQTYDPWKEGREPEFVKNAP